MFKSLFGLTNIRKHSARLSLQVIEGSKRTVPLVCAAAWFLALHHFVRDKLSYWSPIGRGFSLEVMRFIQVSASNAHA